METEKDYTEMDILLAAYFAGEVTSEEKNEVESWRNRAAANSLYFEQAKKTWDVSAQLYAEKKFDTDAAWQRLQGKIENEAAPKSIRSYSWAIAAALALIIGISVFFILNQPNNQAVSNLQLASTNKVLNDTLPDGSFISLNKNTRIDYPSSFTGTNREVALKGEAFFDVHHDASHPFIIHASQVDIRVLGTSFNVIAYPNTDSVHVSVQTGRVQCMIAGDTVLITPGEYAVYHAGNKKFSRGKENDPNRSSYRDRIFSFNNTPLSTAVQQLNDAYGSMIIIKNEQLKNCTFSTTKVFRNEPLENILSLMEATISLTSRREGNTIILDGPGCP
jgi:transmembrane sensor